MTERIGLGGGCHWCTEAVFQALPGVERVEQGFIRSTAPDDAWSEAVIVWFDPELVSVYSLMKAHVKTHAATSEHAMREKYRSAAYVFDARQDTQAREALARLQPAFGNRLMTRVLPFAGFLASDERYRNYYAANPERPFCQRYIQPKLDRIATLESDC